MSKYNTNDPEAVEIRKKIEKLQSMNPAIEIYDVISKKDVELFELVYGVKLPEDYVWFITNVGNGGTWRSGEYRFYPLDLDKPGFLCEELPNHQKGQEKYIFDILDDGCTYSIGVILKGTHFGEISYNTDFVMGHYYPIPLHGFKEFYLKWLEEACLGYDDFDFEYRPYGTIEEHLEQYQKNPAAHLLRSIHAKVTPHCAAKQFLSDVHRVFVSETNHENLILLAKILIKANYEDLPAVFRAIFVPENYEIIVWDLYREVDYFQIYTDADEIHDLPKPVDANGVITDAPGFYPMLVTIMKYYETARARKYMTYCFEMTVMNPRFKAEDILSFLTSDDAEILECLAFVYKDNIKKRVGTYIDEAKKKYQKIKDN